MKITKRSAITTLIALAVITLAVGLYLGGALNIGFATIIATSLFGNAYAQTLTPVKCFIVGVSSTAIGLIGAFSLSIALSRI